jgi:hypothetical protein
MQIGIAAWVEGVVEPVHDCQHDVFYTGRGITPPCKRKATEAGYEPIR